MSRLSRRANGKRCLASGVALPRAGRRSFLWLRLPGMGRRINELAGRARAWLDFH